MKVLTIFGTRPEAIKLAPVIRELQRRSLRLGPSTLLRTSSGRAVDSDSFDFAQDRPLGFAQDRPFDFARDGLQSIVCVTAQHREMLDQVLSLFRIVPDIDLNLMQPGQTPSQVAARVLTELEPILRAERPDWVVVQGDTTTVMAAALAAHYRRIRIAHVEAGLRTGDRFNPFPEEMNRVIADHLSDLHFASTERARQNLLREGISDASIRVTGNTVVDAVVWAAKQRPSPELKKLLQQLRISSDHYEFQVEGSRLGPHRNVQSATCNVKLILVTAHRRESFGPPLRRICTTLRELVRRRDDVQIVYPVHLNPNVWEPVHQLLADVPRIRLLPPVDYLTLVHLMKHSFLILTDSGGIQEEAPSLGVPVLVLREVTERPEAVEAGAARVMGTDPDRILAETQRLLDDPMAHAAMARVANPYGDGHAAERIVSVLLEGSPAPGVQVQAWQGFAEADTRPQSGKR